MGRRERRHPEQSVQVHSHYRPSGQSVNMLWLLAIILVVIVVFVIIRVIVSPDIRVRDIAYPHGIHALVEYNPLVEYPVVDSSMTNAEIRAVKGVIDVVWVIPPDSINAQAYFAFSILRVDPDQGDRFIDTTASGSI